MLRQKSQKTLSLKKEELHLKNPVYELMNSFDVGSQYFARLGGDFVTGPISLLFSTEMKNTNEPS